MRQMAAIGLILLAGCAAAMPVPEWPIPPVGDSVEEIVVWVAANIRYATDTELYGVTGYWATPLETYSLRRGDCEDYCTLALYLIHRDVGIDGYLVVGRLGDATHGWIRVDGADWEVELGRPQDEGMFVEVDVLTYEEAMRMVGYAARYLNLEDTNGER